MEDISRRTLLTGVCALAVGAAAIPTAAASATTTSRSGRLSVRLSRVPALRSVGGAAAVGTLRGVPIGVARTGESTYRAFTLVCPHQGALVSRSASGWRCARHGSEFEPDGDLVLGPATRSLSPIPVKVRGGTLIIG